MRSSLRVIVGALILTPALAMAQESVKRASDTTWFQAPCLGDSVDSFEWTRYDLHGVRIRVPRDIRRVPYPSRDELHFRSGGGTLRLRLHNDASALFARYHTPSRTRRYCTGDIAGLMVEAISIGGPGQWGFAARWADADRGEWLTAVLSAPTLAEATRFRQTLFTLVFPGLKR